MIWELLPFVAVGNDGKQRIVNVAERVCPLVPVNHVSVEPDLDCLPNLPRALVALCPESEVVPSRSHDYLWPHEPWSRSCGTQFEKEGMAAKKGKKKKPSVDKDKSVGLVVVPYIQVLSGLERVFKKHNIAVSMILPTLRNVLVHAKDKLDKFDTCNCVYQIKCSNFDSSYIGEMGRKFKTWLREHKKDIDSIAKAFTRSERKLSQTEFHKSAIMGSTGNNFRFWTERVTNAPGKFGRQSRSGSSESCWTGTRGRTSSATFTILCVPSFPMAIKGSYSPIIAQCQWSSEHETVWVNILFSRG